MIRQEYHPSYPYLEPDDFKAAPFNIIDTVEESGLAIVDPAERVTGDLIGRMGSHLGRVMLAPRPSVRRIAYQGKIIPISANIAPDKDDTQQVFSSNGIGLHIDESGKTPEDHPSHFLLGCVIPPKPGEGGDTVLTFNDRIFAALSPDQQELLANSRQKFFIGDGWTSHSTFISEHDGRRYFSLWDGGTYRKDWKLEIPEGAYESDADEAVKTFFEAALDPSNMRAIPWEPNRVVIVDNRAVVHGRTPQQKQSERLLLHAKIAQED
jgi:hypothetical protein